jgi:crotonobetainyl-CoA:carnitine CoA-transferase CaiB-like acyl-CoA transferase
MNLEHDAPSPAPPSATPSATPSPPPSPAPGAAPLAGTRIVSLALNLPGPAALMRCRALGADCLKIEPPAERGGDPMRAFNAAFYAQLTEGIEVRVLDLKRPADLDALHAELARAELLLTSFRPSALAKLGLDWATLAARHPRLSQVAIVGFAGARADEPGHDLTYVAEAGLLDGARLPPTLWADMSGALMTVEAVLGALLAARRDGRGRYAEVALNDAARFCALPRAHGLTAPGRFLGGAHGGYNVFALGEDGALLAVAALEPHFAAGLARLVGLDDARALVSPAGVAAVRAWAARQTCADIARLAAAHDLPMSAVPAAGAAPAPGPAPNSEG